MKTAQKIAGARALYRLVHAGRKLVGLNDHVLVRRDRITYDLDLAQGIDFAVFLGIYERSTARALKKLVKPASLVLDIGANIGAHTLRLADLVGSEGRVFAFEPTEFAFTKLQRNLNGNPDVASRVKSFHCFLAGSRESAVPDAIYSSWPLVGGTELHSKHLGRAMQTKAAHVRTIDSVLAENAERRVQLVKLDVDGYECQVLAGATRMLQLDRPIFVMELAPYVLDERGSSLGELLSFFVPNGYAFYAEKTERRLPSNAQELRNLIADGESMNVIARAS